MADFPPRVRLATPADEEKLYALLADGPQSLSGDNGFGVPIDRDKVLSQLRIGTEERGGFIGVIDADSDSLAASVGVFLGAQWYSKEETLYELWTFVRPDQRDLGYERDLFQFMRWTRERFSLAMGREVTLITSVSSPRRLAAKTRLWRRLIGPAGRHIGSIFAVSGPHDL